MERLSEILFTLSKAVGSPYALIFWVILLAVFMQCVGPKTAPADPSQRTPTATIVFTTISFFFPFSFINDAFFKAWYVTQLSINLLYAAIFLFLLLITYCTIHITSMFKLYSSPDNRVKFTKITLLILPIVAYLFESFYSICQYISNIEINVPRKHSAIGIFLSVSILWSIPWLIYFTFVKHPPYKR
ncbi:membrane hypothetical protein [uncultured delta proteobacterium]|uniref:Uncharacterized protein n=1 Tax=uncultured delta proteobacterium TaxID=34034 RepID=A0A212JI23_9DELT|nr:membrane hypothetical protein [uncultured delta proteobacterium]